MLLYLSLLFNLLRVTSVYQADLFLVLLKLELQTLNHQTQGIVSDLDFSGVFEGCELVLKFQVLGPVLFCLGLVVL